MYTPPKKLAATVIGTVATQKLAIGVGVGVIVAVILFARRVAHFVTGERGAVPTQPGGDGRGVNPWHRRGG
ncbi:hypothetical protein ACX80W_11295 [Arthrobacter sp. TMN-37]